MPKLRILSIEGIEEIRQAMEDIGAHTEGIRIMVPKARFEMVKISGLDARGANILKQEMLARGGDAVLSKDAYHLERSESTATLAFGTVRQLREMAEKLSRQPFGLKEVGRELVDALDAYDSPVPPLEVGGGTLDLNSRTFVMGIVNVTPDSFSDGGEHFGAEAAIAHAGRLIDEGADIIDIGGESTRPGAEPVAVEEEMTRVIPVIEALSGSGVFISIDTAKPEVARVAIEAGAQLVNDVTGLGNPEMLEVVAASRVPAIVMHMKGTPRIMQNDPVYDDLMGEIVDFLRSRLRTAEAAGVVKEKLLVDPGIGFGKTVGHNLEIVKRLSELKILGRGIVIGTSRKAFIGTTLGLEAPSERLLGTAATMALAIANGANIIRVHDVAEMVQVAKMTDAVTTTGSLL